MGERQLEQPLEFKYLGFTLNEASTDGVESCGKMANGRKLACESRSLVNARSLQFEWKKYCMGDYL